MPGAENSNIPNLIMMVRPKHFGFNPETAQSNSFQQKIDVKDVVSKAQGEFDEMVNVLRSKHIEVKVFEDQEIVVPDAVFPNNWISHQPDGKLIVYPMLTPNRRAEVRSDIIDWCVNTLHPSELIDLTPNVGDDAFLEGTGSIVFDHIHKTAYACISPRTNLKLLSELMNRVGYKTISFESVDQYGERIYHTNVMMSMGRNLVLICLDSVENILERSMLKETLEKSGKEIIELSYQQMNAFAGNAFEVLSKNGNYYYVMSETAFAVLTPNQKDTISQKSEILNVKIPTIEQVGGGSARCMMAGFFNYPR
ncbi:MAG: amidinotransferase [Crocinitomicaceae bacterium]|nr:amidinotransferase [Crocinitomicaceae bacterium]